MGNTQVYTYLTLDGRKWFRSLSFTSEDNVPLSCLILDRSCFDGSLNGPMQLHLDAADFREADVAIMCEAVAALWIGEGIVAVPPLKPGKAWGLTIVNPTKEVLEGSF